MVYYISSQVYQQTINTTLREQNQVIAQSMIENHMQLYKYVKGNITKFGIDMDTLIVDLSALDDSDEDILNAVKTIRTLYDATRIIILAPTRIPGDRLLSDLFALGILNIIATSDYLALKQELILCLSEKGKSFKDALAFKDIKEGIEIKRERQKVVSRVLIGIAGSQPRVGSTHTILMLAGYLRKLGFLVAAVERNSSGDFEWIRQGHGEKLYDQSYFIVHGVDYYPRIRRKEQMKTIIDKSYNFILCDYGYLYDCDQPEFMKCHEKLLIAGSKTWELHYLQKILKEYSKEMLEQFHFCFNLVHTGYEKQLRQAMKFPDGTTMQVFFLPYWPEPFNSDDFAVAEEILGDYLQSSGKRTKKGLLPFWKSRGGKG